MKKIVLLTLLISFRFVSSAQADTIPVYRRFPTIPPFTIIKLADSSKFTKEDLAKKKQTIFIIFNPFCDHCKNETRDIIANMELFKDVQIVMASPIENKYLKQFYDELKIAEHPNIIFCRDPGNYFGTFFSVMSVPATFVYDKKGNFVKAFDAHATYKEIAEAL